MKVPGQKEIDAAAGKPAHRLPRPSHQMPRVIVRRKIEGMVRHQNPHPAVRAAQLLLYALNLLAVDASSLDRHTASGVQPENRDLLICIKRFQVFRDVPPIVIERPSESGQQITERHIMIPGNDDLRSGKCVEEHPRPLELLTPRTLRQVAGDCDHVGLNQSDRRNQRAYCRLMGAAEVNVRQMDYGFDAASPSGTMM